MLPAPRRRRASAPHTAMRRNRCRSGPSCSPTRSSPSRLDPRVAMRPALGVEHVRVVAEQEVEMAVGDEALRLRLRRRLVGRRDGPVRFGVDDGVRGRCLRNGRARCGLRERQRCGAASSACATPVSETPASAGSPRQAAFSMPSRSSSVFHRNSRLVLISSTPVAISARPRRARSRTRLRARSFAPHLPLLTCLVCCVTSAHATPARMHATRAADPAELPAAARPARTRRLRPGNACGTRSRTAG